MHASRSPSTDRPASPVASRGQARPRSAARYTPIRRILCPVDFSDCSRTALRHAVALAQPTRAEITGLFVMSFVFPGEGAGFPAAVPPDPGVVSAVSEDLEGFLRPAREAGLDVRVVVKSGGTIDHILEQARERESDLIVMGTHGRSGLARLVVGSVTRSVLGKAPCPVLTVPREKDGGPAHADVDRILCAVRLTEASPWTVSYTFGLARSLGAAVTLIHVLPSRRDPAVLERRASEARRRLQATVQAQGEPGCPVEEMVVVGSAHREILRLAREKRADVVVLGIQGRGPGSTDDHVLGEAEVPVLTVRPPAPARRA